MSSCGDVSPHSRKRNRRPAPRRRIHYACVAAATQSQERIGSFAASRTTISLARVRIYAASLRTFMNSPGQEPISRALVSPEAALWPAGLDRAHEKSSRVRAEGHAEPWSRSAYSRSRGPRSSWVIAMQAMAALRDASSSDAISATLSRSSPRKPPASRPRIDAHNEAGRLPQNLDLAPFNSVPRDGKRRELGERRSPQLGRRTGD
jgi:hypothetical protein